MTQSDVWKSAFKSAFGVLMSHCFFASKIDCGLKPIISHQRLLIVMGAIGRHFKRLSCLLLIPIAWIASQHFGIAINLTTSFPQKIWLIRLNAIPRLGDYLLFKPPLSANVPEGTTVIKQVVGIPGDTVTRVEQDFFINGHYIAQAKRISKQGELLEPSSGGILKEGQYYVWSPHPDSFDSRYQKMGLVESHQLLGVAYALW
jgi:conjugal transfer pilin signal peptidase TrbI